MRRFKANLKPAPVLLTHADLADKKRRRLISSACGVMRAGLKVEQMLQWLLSQERRSGEPVMRSWEEWGRTLQCHPITAKRQAMPAFSMSLLIIAETITRSGGDGKNRFAIDWVGIDEVLGVDRTSMTTSREGVRGGRANLNRPDARTRFVEPPTVDRDANCVGEGSILQGGGEQNAHALKDITLSSSLETTLSSSTTYEAATVDRVVKEGEGDMRDGMDFEPAAKPLRSERFKCHADSTAANESKKKWVEDAYRKGVRKAAEAVEAALAEGRDVPGILKHFEAAMIGWERAMRGVILYRRLTESPPGVRADEGWPPYDFPRLVVESQTKEQKTENSCDPQQPSCAKGQQAYRRAEGCNKEIEMARITARLKAMTPEERVAELLKISPDANEFDRLNASRFPSLLAIRLFEFHKLETST